jgi:hypothetical protein
MIQFMPPCCMVKHDGNVILVTLADANVVHGLLAFRPRGPAHGLPLPFRVVYLKEGLCDELQYPR